MYTQAESSINRVHRHVMTPSASCATVRPSEYCSMIDTKGVDPAQYERDVAACQTFARQISQEPGEKQRDP